ncbi:MAG: methyltransferase domain-containing protein [Actinomycetota bacterium]
MTSTSDESPTIDEPVRDDARRDVTQDATHDATHDGTHDAVRDYYRDAVRERPEAPAGDERWGAAQYDHDALGQVDQQVANLSMGCGNPFAMAELAPGEVVLDLGSGGGLDVILSARRVGPTGKAFGLDFLEEMLTTARENAADAGVDNVEFLHGMIEDVPLPDASVDVVISNCVINLAPDKQPVFDEIARVLRPGGRLAVSDVVAVDGYEPTDDRQEWAECGAGALEHGSYLAMLAAAGLIDCSIERTHETATGLYAATVRAIKPTD